MNETNDRVCAGAPHEGNRRAGLGARSSVGIAITFAFLALLLFAGQASAQDQGERLHQINWAHSAPNDVSRFVVLISPVEGSVADARQVDVGKPAAQTLGSMSVFTALVAFQADEYLAVAAVGHNGQMSTPSAWSGMPPTRPGQPLPVDN